MNEAQLDDFREFVSLGCDLDLNHVIPAQDKGPLPHDPFASVHELRDNLEGTLGRALRQVDNGTRGDYSARRLAVLSLQFWRLGANARADAFVIWIGTELGLLEADRRDFRIGRPLQVRNISAIVADEWEERAAIDIQVKYVQSINQAIGQIESVPIDITEVDSSATVNLDVQRASGG